MRNRDNADVEASGPSRFDRSGCLTRTGRKSAGALLLQVSARASICAFALWAIAYAATAEAQQQQADVCRASWPARLADAKHAVSQWEQARAERKRVGADAKIAWFDAHCRFLTRLELAIRKLDDPNAFVCDTQKGRPAGLTPTFVLEHAQPPQLLDYQEQLGEDRACEAFDAAERVSLVISELDDAAGIEQRLRVLCFDDVRPRCIKARDAVDGVKP